VIARNQANAPAATRAIDPAASKGRPSPAQPSHRPIAAASVACWLNVLSISSTILVDQLVRNGVCRGARRHLGRSTGRRYDVAVKILRWTPRRRTRSRLLGGIGAITLALWAIGCGGPDAAHYNAVLDELAIPADWELAAATVSEPGFTDGCASFVPGCPRVTRYYLAPGVPIDAFPAASQMLATAGFAVVQEFDPECDAPSSTTACAIRAARDDDGLLVSIYNPGDDFDAMGIARDDRTLIRIIATDH
jgi:hypothetical protein